MAVRTGVGLSPRRRRRPAGLSRGWTMLISALCLPQLGSGFMGGRAAHDARQGLSAGLGPRGVGALRAAEEGEEPEGTRVEEALRMTTKEINALRRLVSSFEDLPAPNEAPSFPPSRVDLPAPTRDSVDADRGEILRINREYYERLNERDVRGMLGLWREEGDVQMYMNENDVVKGRSEIDKHYDGKFRNTWATNKHHKRMDCAVEDERVFLRGINAFVTNKEVWENPKTKERKVMFCTKVLTRSNGVWRVVHVHTGDSAQVEVSSQQPQGQLRLPDQLRALAAQQGQAGQQGQNILGALGLGGAAGGEEGADPQGIRTIITPEGYRIIVSGNQQLGGQGQGQAQQGRTSESSKEAMIKAIIEDLAKNGKGDIIPLQLGANRNRGQGLFSSSSSAANGESSRANQREEGGGKPAENLTKKTVSAIRQLCVDGRITVQQKRKLIFSIIRSTKAEETAQAELAYDLLVENALAGEENALDEFADQCRIIVDQLIEEEQALAAESEYLFVEDDEDDNRRRR